MTILDGLNPVQKEAVSFDAGPLLILAGAGSGKTRVLATRIAYLIGERGVRPEEIIAVTFTNKAAGEMRERVASLVGDKARRVWLGTFHSIGLRILRMDGWRMGLAKELTVYSDDDQLKLVKNAMAELNMGDKALTPKAILGRINQAKNELIGPEEFLEARGDFLSERIARVYTLYQKRLRQNQALDFGDLICEPVRLFNTHKEVMDAYRSRFRHVMVDEYQDTNASQYTLMNIFASKHRNICAVGDPDQSIYAWRGADISNILGFQEDWPDSTLLRLEQNYRSTKTVLAAANSVIKRNSDRLDKTLWTENPDGEPVRYEEAGDEHGEARTVTGRIAELSGAELSGKNTKLDYGSFAVFYRTNAQSRVFEEHFMREGIPYTVVGGQRFYDRREIRDALAYLRVVNNPADSLSLLRVVNTPARKIGKGTVLKIQELAGERGATLYDAFRAAIDEGTLARTGAGGFFSAIEAFRKDTDALPLHELALRLLEDSGYMAIWIEEGSEESLTRVENLHELISAIRDFEELSVTAETEPTLQAFLDQVSLISDVDSYEDKAKRVTIMTLHSAKGLEFPVVFMVGMEDGLFPHSRSAMDPDQLEEERRLCYVGMTRAEERLFLLSAKTRMIFGETRYQCRSRFIDEIDQKLLERLDNTGADDYRDDIYEEDDYEEDTYEEEAHTETSGSVPKKGRDSHKENPPNEPYYTTDESQLTPGVDRIPATPGGDRWRVGIKVRHPSFGLGIIKAREGAGENTKLTVLFKHAGKKKLVVKYAHLMPVV